MTREEYIKDVVDKFFEKYPAAAGESGFDFLKSHPDAQSEYIKLFSLLRDNYEEANCIL